MSLLSLKQKDNHGGGGSQCAAKIQIVLCKDMLPSKAYCHTADHLAEKFKGLVKGCLNDNDIYKYQYLSVLHCHFYLLKLTAVMKVFK